MSSRINQTLNVSNNSNWIVDHKPQSALSTSTTSVMEEDVTPESFLVAMCIMSVIILIGSFGNGVVMYVYARKNDKLTATVFILALSIVDFITCVLIIPMTIAMEIIKFHTSSIFFCRLYYILNTSGIPFSSLLMSAIALDRYFCICHPFLRVMTLKRAKMIICLLSLVSLTMGVLVAFICIRVVPTDQLLNLTTNFNHTHHPHHHKERNSSTDHSAHICIETYMFKKKGGHAPFWEETFFNIIQKVHITCFILCIVLVIILYVLIYQTVLAMRKKRQLLKGKKVRLSTFQKKSRDKAARLEPMYNHISDCKDNHNIISCPEKVLYDRQRCTDEEVDLNNTASSGSDNTNSEHYHHKMLQANKSTMCVKVIDKQSLQNFKTAAMLFVVAVVFIVTFVPAGLMANAIVDFNIIVFYMYYTNNAANPIIYCFMNKNFRADLRKIFVRKRNRFR